MKKRILTFQFRHETNAFCPRQVHDAQIFRIHGIAPETENLLVVKSTIHYRADFGKFARELIPVVVPGCASPIPDGYAYKNWKG